MKKRKIIFIDFTPITQNRKELFCLNIFEENGFDVEYWTLYPYYHPKIQYPDELSSTNYFLLKSLDDMETRLSDIDPKNALVIVESCSYIYRACFRLLAQYNIVTTRIYPFSGISNLKMNLKGKIRRVLSSNPIPKGIDFLKEKVLYKLYKKKYGIPDKMIVFSSSQPRTGVINHPDYNNYLKIKNDKDQIVEEKYIVFIDIYFPLHPDFIIYKNKKIDKDPSTYRQSLNKFFDYVENRYKMPVIIAAHPKSLYKGDEFGNRKIIVYQTCKLVKNSELVITHLSTSTAFAILFNRPTVFIITDGMAKDSKLFYKLKCYAKQLHKNVYNIDHDDFSKFDFSDFNPTDRNHYIYTYLTTPETENLSNKDLIIKEYTTLFEKLQDGLLNAH